jgi:hypothetical protein
MAERQGFELQKNVSSKLVMARDFQRSKAGLQVALTETLLNFGAAVDGAGQGAWTRPLMTALTFGYLDTALVR